MISRLSPDHRSDELQIHAGYQSTGSTHVLISSINGKHSAQTTNKIAILHKQISRRWHRSTTLSSIFASTGPVRRLRSAISYQKGWTRTAGGGSGGASSANPQEPRNPGNQGEPFIRTFTASSQPTWIKPPVGISTLITGRHLAQGSTAILSSRCKSVFECHKTNVGSRV